MKHKRLKFKKSYPKFLVIASRRITWNVTDKHPKLYTINRDFVSETGILY